MEKMVVTKEVKMGGRGLMVGANVTRCDEWKNTPDRPVATFDTPVGKMPLFMDEVESQ